MSQDTEQKPSSNGGDKSASLLKSVRKQERLQQMLKQNLARRKTQQELLKNTKP